MKILFLHISDIHIEKKTDINCFRLQKIVDSLNVMGDFEHVIIVVSGDIAYSGKSYQYDFAWNLLGNIINKLKIRYVIKSKPTVLVVPGNHDVDLSMNDLGHAQIQELFRSNKMETYIVSECEKLHSFIKFANTNRCFDFHNQLYLRKKIEIENFSIEVNLLNSALFSTNDEEKGLHYFPHHVINQLCEPSGADFVITVMHHSPHWFNENNKAELEKFLISKSSLVFLGHEHNLDTKDISFNGNPNVEVMGGGVLCNKGDWRKSEYFASVLDTNDLKFSLFGFSWNSQETIYTHIPNKPKYLPHKPSSEKKLVPSSSYLKVVCEDQKCSLHKEFIDYFVFPRLQFEGKNDRSVDIEIVNEKEFLAEFETKKKMIIVGYPNSGKTVLLKHLFLTLSKKKVVLFCNIYSIRSGNCNRIIKNVFEDIYGENPNDYIRFQQMPKQEKILIIDDINLVDSRNFDAFLGEIEKNFEYIICSSNQVMELNIQERAKQFMQVMQGHGLFYRYRLLPFFSDKRNELISNIVKIKIPDVEDRARISGVLSDSLKKQRSMFNLTPDFIIQFVEYFCNNIKSATQNDGEVFSKVFEANIVNSVAPYSKKLKVDKIFIVLDKVAYFIHKNKEYPLMQTDLADIINLYNEKYGDDINIADFIQITRNAKILVSCDSGIEYKFCNKNYLAYFIAREIKRRYHEDKDESDLINILNYSCFGINGDILLFLTYITDNINMLRLIVRVSKELTSDWKEFDLDEGNIPYLTNIKPLEITAPTAENKKEAEKKEIEQEKRAGMINTLDPIDIYDYKETEINKFMNQLYRGVSLLGIISRCLPSFEYMMLKGDKEMFVDLIYRLPNQIFYNWANEIEKNKQELIEFIKLQDNDYIREKNITENDILRLLQWDSMSLYLDILYMPTFNSTKENTDKYLNSFDYNSGTTYALQHLMMLERSEKISAYIKEATKIYDASKNTTSSIMVKRITHHVLIHSKSIQVGEIQQLEGKYFPNRDKYFTNSMHHKKLLLQRIKSEQGN